MNCQYPKKDKPCKKEVIPGVEIDGKCLCGFHYGFEMYMEKLKQLGISLEKPVSTEQVVMVACNQISKAGKPCHNKSAPDCEGMCKIHWKSKSKRDASSTTEVVEAVKCKGVTEAGKECTKSAVKDCDGFCKMHWNKKNKTPKSKTPKSVSSIVSDAAALLASKAPPLPNFILPIETTTIEFPSSPKMESSTNPFANVEIPPLE